MPIHTVLETVAKTEAVFFDLDGTLVEAGAAWHSAVRDTVRFACGAAPGTDTTALVKACYEAARANWITNGHSFSG